MNAAIRYDGLNPQAQALTEAQTELKVLVKRAVLHGTAFATLNRQVQAVVRRALAGIKSPVLRGDAERALYAFASRIYRRLRVELGVNSALLAALLVVAAGGGKPAERKLVERYLPVTYETDAKGVPLQMYAKDYVERKVKPALEELARMQAKDPNDLAGRNSLRNLAEMQVRYEAHLQEISDLRASGERLVVCSVHADCSERCAPWQGRVYSLDGTTGRTADGRSFVPLEEATDVYYTTKAGRTYKNGLLGFNCRHRLFPYREGMVIPRVSEREQKREYAITREQRELERRVLEARTRAELYRDELPKEARAWQKKARALYEEYRRFSKENGRAYYPSRTRNI